MKEKHEKIKKMTIDICWEHAYFTLEDLYYNYCYDEKFKAMLFDLMKYIDKKITPPDDAGKIVNKYMVIEYMEE